jgi:hypothetical protein
MGKEPSKTVKTEKVYKACCYPDKQDASASTEQKSCEFHQDGVQKLSLNAN